MSHLKPRLLTDSQLRRYEDCAVENNKLADCWNGQHVVMLTFDWAEAYNYSGCTTMPALHLDIMSPAETPTWGSPNTGKRPARQVYECTIRMLEKTKVNRRLRPKPFYMKIDAHETFELYSEEAKTKAQDTFDALARDYAAMCIVNHDVRESMRMLETFGVELPSKVVWVDLIKVMEHQTRDEGIPEKLEIYTDENVAVRNGRYDRRAGVLRGWYGLPSLRLLEVLGPAAESHRRGFKKAEKEDAALKRIAGRIRNR